MRHLPQNQIDAGKHNGDLGGTHTVQKDIREGMSRINSP